MSKPRRLRMEEKNEAKAEVPVREERAEAAPAQGDEEMLAAALLRGPQSLRRAPRFVSIEKNGGLRIPGLSANASAALAASGFRDPASLEGFRVMRMGENAKQLGLRDLDRIHRESVAAAYRGKGLDAGVVAHLADNRVMPHEVAGFFRWCDGVISPYPWTPKALDLGRRLKPDVMKGMRPGDWRDAMAPRGGATDPPRDWRADVAVRPTDAAFSGRLGLLGAKDVARVRVDLQRVDDLLSARPGADNVAEMVTTSQALLVQGRKDLSYRLAAHAASADATAMPEAQRYQVQVVAPSTAALATEAGAEVRLAIADQTLVSAKAGSREAENAAREAVRLARQRADATFLAASRIQGPAREAALDLAREQYLNVLSGAGLEKGREKAALGVQSSAALLDLARATSVAVHSPSQAAQVRSSEDVTFDGRTMPASGAAWLMGTGGVASTVDPLIKGHVLHAWNRLQLIEAPELLRPVAPLGGDLFRFDFLLGEVRRLAEDVARIESLLTQFKQMLLDQAMGKLDLLPQVTAELARLVDGLVKKVQALAAAVPGVLQELVQAARDKAVVIAVVEAMKAWPHERWVDLFDAVADAVGSGSNVGDAIMARVRSWLQPEIAAILGGVRTQLTTTLQALTAQVQGAALPQSLLDDLGELYAEAGGTNATAEIIAPLEAALDNLDLVALAQPFLDELNAATVPAWLEGLLLGYVVAPLVVAIGVAIGFAIVGGGIGAVLAAAAIAGLIALGTQYLVSLVLRALGDALGLAAQLQSTVDRATAQLNDLVGGLLASLADVGALQGMIAGVVGVLRDIEKLLPHEVAAAVMDALTTARDTILDNAQKLSMALQRAFFRETLEYVDEVPLAFGGSLPLGGAMVGYADPRYGASAEVAAVASSFEVERVTRMQDSQQVLTQVLSLRQLLPGGVQELQPLLAGLPVNFSITQQALDRIAPGLHRVLVKDVEVHVDFEVPAATQATLKTIMDAADVVAGLRVDPALDGRIPGGGFPALPVVAGRVPTGIPALLTHLGESRVRLKPSKKLKEAYVDACGRRKPQWKLAPTLRGTSLLPDPDPDAHSAGWRHLQLLDKREEMLFSHFDVLSDSVRFVHANKSLKPFEHRGIVGSFRLEIPALVLGSVVHQLPAIRDVRLVVSTVAHYDRQLADLVPQVPVQVVEPTPDATGLPGVQTIEDLLNQLDATIQSLTGALEDTVDTLGASLNGLVDVAAQVEDAMEEATNALNTATIVRLSGALATPTAAGNTLQSVLLRTGTLANQAQVLAGLAPASWSVTGVDPAKVVRVVEVVLSPVTTAALLGGAGVTFPATPATVGFVPAGAPSGTAPETGQAALRGDGSSRIPGTEFATTATQLANPNGTWTLQLPTGIPVAPASPALTEMLVGILLEVRP